MRFGQNVLRTTWKKRFVQFSWKAHCFPVLKRISGQCDEFENFDAQKCDLAKTCCAWPEKRVLYNFYGKRTIFSFWREFEASVTILTTLTLKNAIWPKRAPHDLKRAFCTIFMESAMFSLFGENLRPVWRFWQLWRSKMRFDQNVLCMTWKEGFFLQFLWKAHCFPVLKRIWGQCDDFDNFHAQKCDLAKTCCAWPEKSVMYNFHGKRNVFPFWREFKASVTNLTTLTLKNAIWPKRALHDLKNGFCTIFMKSALFSPFGENLRPVWRFRQLWRSKMRFDQNVLRMTWKERFVQFPWKAHCFPVLQRIWGQCDDFENFDAHKCELAKTCCSWPKKRVLYNFYGKRTVFPFRREFETSVTIFRSLTLKNAIWPNRAAHDLKRRFCTIFIISALFCLLGKIFRPVWRFWELWPSQMRFCQNVLRMTWNERFVQFSWKPHCFPLLGRISGQCDAHKCDLAKTCCAWPEKRVFLQFLWKAHCFPVSKRIWDKCNDFQNFDPHKCDFAKTCCAWPETSVLYNFHGNRTVFHFWEEFQASVTNLRTLTLTNAIWPKRAPHDLKRAFCTIFMESALFSLFGENLRPVWRFRQLWRSKMRFG